METRITEQSSLYHNLEKKSIGEIIRDINHENTSVPKAIDKALPYLEKLISAIVEHISAGGRSFYCGCGTGGRLSVLDTIEVQNTYGTDGSIIQGIFPGGIESLTQTRESREDDIMNGWQQLRQRKVSAKDIVVGFSASGTTPFVLAGLNECKKAGITTGSVVNNPDAPISQVADFPVAVITGPEYVTGSTRMKAGTSQKLILDMISTTTMIKLGRVEDNKMVNARLVNTKLIDRAVRIFMERNKSFNDSDEVKKLLLRHGSVKKAEEFILTHDKK